MYYKILAGLGLGAVLSLGPAVAQENINITVISGNAPQMSAVHAVSNGFIPSVDSILAETGNYKISWNEAYSGQIAKPRAELGAIESGLGDVGVIITAYTPDKLPLHQIAFFAPFTSQDVAVQAGALNKLLATDAYQQEWDGFNQKALRISGVVDAYTLFSSIPLATLADLEGKKIAGVGANLPWISAAGAGAVTGEMATAYNSLENGVYDGMLLWQQIATALKFCEPAPYALVTGAGGSPTVTLTVNSDVWNSLPEEVQQAFTQGAEAWHESNMEALLTGSAGGRAACEQNYGQITTTLSDEDMKAWAERLPPVGKEWAQRAIDRGAPGDEILATYMDHMRENGQTILRDWDKE